MNERGVTRVTLLLLLLIAGNAFAASRVLPLPATLNQQQMGEIDVRVEEAELVAVDFTPLRARLERLLSPAQFAQLPAGDPAWVSPAQLEAAGVRVEFDFADLTLRLTVPPEQRRTETVDLIGTPEVRAFHTALPEVFSAYLNLRGGVDYIETSRVVPEGFTDPQLAFENAFNLRGWVLESESAVNPHPDQTWAKRDTRLVHDMPEQRLRWTLGDLNYPVTSFQGFIPMAGLSLHRENSLQPYRITSPLGQSAFYLKEPSKVEVLVNGHAVHTLQLGPGPHRLSNFPLTGGANDVVLRITDPVGRVEEIKATFFYDSVLLKQGESEFSYGVGLPSRPDPDDPFYEYRAEPAASAFHRWGLTDTLTVGVNGQAMRQGQSAGTELVYNTAVGVFDLEAGLTQAEDVGWGHAERVQYRYYAPAESLLKDGVLSLAVRHTSDDFAVSTPFTEPVAPGETWDFQARYSQRLTDHLSAGLAYGEQLWRGETSLRTGSLTLSHRWRRFSTDVTLQRNEGPASTDEWAGHVSFVVQLGRGATAFASYDTPTHSTRAELQYSPPRNVESLSGAIGMQDVSGDQNVYGNLRYYGRRAELTLSQDSYTTGENRASLRWGTALVYAGGGFGVSRPVQDSFAVFESTGSLREEGGLGVQPQGPTYTAREDWLGPAVMPELTAYYNTRVVAEPLEASADFDPQEGDLLLKPTYRSGTRVRIGRPARTSVTATLVWADGKPAALQSGRVIGPDGAITEFITNREGLTYLYELPGGAYRGTLEAHPDAPFTFTIPADQPADLKLGSIRVPAQE